MQIDFAALSDTGRRRQVNEDRVLALEVPERRAFVFAVADGVGGMVGGSDASQAVVRELTATFEGAVSLGDPLALLVEGIEAANRRMVAEQGRGGKGSTTVVAAVAWDGRFGVAHVGDSRCYLWRAAELLRLTEDHSLVAEQVRAGIITESEASQSRHRNIITRSIGTQDPLDVETRSPEPLRSGDTLLLCSDGLHGVVTPDEIGEVLGGAAEAAAAAARLVALANERGGPDNISVVVARVTSAG